MFTRKLPQAILAIAMVSGCMGSREGDLVEPQPGPAQREQNGDDANQRSPSQWEKPGAEDPSVQLDLEKQAFENYAIDTDSLFYALDFQDESGRSIVKVDRTRLDFDATTGKATIAVKVPDRAVGYVFLKIEDNVPENDKFEGRSDKVTISGPTRIAMTLAKVGDATITVNVTLDDDDVGPGSNSNDPGSNAPDPNDQDPGNQNPDEPDVSNIANSELRALALKLGDPKKMQSPTAAQVRAIAAEFCSVCHRPGGSASGDASTEAFYRQKPISAHLNAKTMPPPTSSFADDMDDLAAAGFDYRAVMIRFAKSLGNNR